MTRTKLLAILFPVQIAFVSLLSLFPEFVERWYSNGIFPYISTFERIVFGLFGFSIGDIIYGVVIILGLRWFWKTRKTWRKKYGQNLLTIVATLSVVYFLFTLLWALNYRRMPLYKKMGIERDYTEQQLIDFTKRLIIKTNAIHTQIEKNDTIKVASPYTPADIYRLAPKAYKNLGKDFAYFAYEHESIKSSLFSTTLSYMGFGGYLNPFTNEAQVNMKLPLYNLPATTCHEMSHQIGYANESEANFIGFMANVYSDDIYFKYSGYSFALRYCINNIAKFDEAKAKSLLPLIHQGIKNNFKESREFNKKYESFIEDIFEYFYDNYLKMNKQKDGMETYSKFTGLLVNYYKDKEL
ncbi:DUF3810 domain-containing protein [Flavobacterium psychrotrophum]|uniref:DUF3810 domain-containing protein n=1 Tax=Flavobacterium psychrotrophum TaxID=2294119 RepID=UPI000E31A718|nr:DUF3810 domain-containing protein [Flavobacterium psychrotrophum]